MTTIKPAFTEYQDLERYGYLLEKIDEWEGGQAQALAEWLIEHFHPKSVVDIGCASGLYLLPFMAQGIEIFGMDGAPQAGSKLSPEWYRRWDFRKPFAMAETADLCLCLEVAEHIEEPFADEFIRSLVTVSNRIVFSAATPGQGGEGHYNENTQSYWLEKFARYGFELDPLNEEFHAFVAKNEHQWFHPWLINNGVILYLPPLDNVEDDNDD